MQKRTILAVNLMVGCALLAGCSDGVAPTAVPQQAPAQPQASATTVTTPVAPAPPQQAMRQIVRGNLRFIDGYAAGVQAAAAQRKPMLLFFTASWCGYCHQLAAEAFTNEAVVKLSEQFVCVLVDADREPGICQQFQVRGYPTIQFVSSRGQLLNRMVGKEPSHVLVRQMHAALQGLAGVNAAGTSMR